MFAACRKEGEARVEHALDDGRTLCGIAENEVDVFRHLRHLWYPDCEDACAACLEAFPYDIAAYIKAMD